MKLTGKKLLIFDLDGTIADTIGAITEAVNMALDRFGYPRRTEDEVRRAIGNGARMLVKRLMPPDDALNDDKVAEVLTCYDKMYEITHLHTTEMYNGVEQAVKSFVTNGVKVAVLSNKQDAYVKGLVKQFFANGEISIAQGQTELPIKPAPDAVYNILNEAKVTAAECVFVGDSEVDLKTAQNSKMDFIGVSWGFLGREKLREAGANIIVDEPAEILKLLNVN